MVSLKAIKIITVGPSEQGLFNPSAETLLSEYYKSLLIKESTAKYFKRNRVSADVFSCHKCTAGRGTPSLISAPQPKHTQALVRLNVKSNDIINHKKVSLFVLAILSVYSLSLLLISI